MLPPATPMKVNRAFKSCDRGYGARSNGYNTYFADVDGGEILGFSYSYSGGQFIKGSQLSSPVIASSFLDPCDQYLSNKATAATPATASIDINHPYAANSGGYADRTIRRNRSLRCRARRSGLPACPLSGADLPAWPQG